MAAAGKQLDEQKIIDRIRQGQRFVERGIANRDKIASKRFLDGSEAGVDIQHEDYYVDMAGVLPSSQEVGNVNYLAINILTKVAAIAIGDPDWHIEHDDPTAAEIVRRLLRSLWKARAWARVCRKALLKRSISGLGIIAFLWDPDKGPVIEHVRCCDLAIDPNVVDWHNPRWAGRQVRIPREEAMKRWPSTEFDSVVPDIPNMDETSAMPSETIKVWAYWDQDEEVILYGSQLLERGPNLYGRVPLIFLEGDIAPESEFSLGDYDTAVGLQIELARLQSIVNNLAENGGSIGWYNAGLLDDASKDAFANGRPNGFIAINGSPDAVFGYKTGAPLDQSLLEAFKIAQQGLDSVTGVSEYQRGVINQSVKFATEAAMLSNQSGSRGTQARVEYEQFLDEIGRAILGMILKFGMALADPMDPHDGMLMEALQGVQDMAVLDSSTAYKDPAYEIQSSMQFAQAMAPFIQAGIVNAVPVAMKLIRAFGERDPNKYLNSQQPGQALMPGVAPGQPGPAGDQMSGGVPAAPPGQAAGLLPTSSPAPQTPDGAGAGTYP